jgi:hypothetical protein
MRSLKPFVFSLTLLAIDADAVTVFIPVVNVAALAGMVRVNDVDMYVMRRGRLLRWAVWRAVRHV